MKRYPALLCRADRDSLDLLIARSSILPTTGILDNDTDLVLYFNEGELSDEMIEQIRSWLPEGSDVERSEVEEQNWNAEFEKSLEPIAINDRLTISQSWNDAASSDVGMTVVIDPKMSFGTGHHESTRLIARLQIDLDMKGKRVLDIGTGTGVLAIIAAMSDASVVVAFDNNEWAVRNTRENIALNRVEGRIEVIEGELSDVAETGFDIILANLHRNLIIELLPEIASRLAGPGSTLLTSGVLIVDYDGLIEAAAAVGLSPTSEQRENDWVATRWERMKDE
jgi:ribosomal protein L11 methyltransferase